MCGQEIETVGVFHFTCFSYSVNKNKRMPKIHMKTQIL